MNKKVITQAATVFIVPAAVLFVCFWTACLRQEDNWQNKQETGQQKEAGFQFNDDGTVTLGEGYTAHGFYTKDGNLVDPKSEVECADGCIRGWIAFQQNITGTMEYGLIIMEDFIQKEFLVGNERFDCYRFSLSGEDEARIAIEIPVGDSAYEIEYLIVPWPDEDNFSMDSKSGWNNFLATRTVCTSSYRIADHNGNTRVPPVYEQIDTGKLGELHHKGNTGFELVKSSDKLEVFDTAKSGSHACLCMGGMRKEVDAYVVVAFCNWKQTEVGKEQLVRCYTSVPDRNSYDEIIFPNIKEDAVYQMFAFELPIETRMIALVNQTFRIKLGKK